MPMPHSGICRDENRRTNLKKASQELRPKFFGAAERATISPREDCCRLWQQRRRLSCGGSNPTYPAHREGLARPAEMRCSLICCIRCSLDTAPTTSGFVCIFLFAFVQLVSLLRRNRAIRSSSFKIGVRPFKIDIAIDRDFDDGAFPSVCFRCPPADFATHNVILKQFNVIFADRCGEQLAQISQ